MKFKSNEEKKNFLEDKAFYISPDSFCLGKDLKTAGNVFKELVSDIKQQEKKNEREGKNNS